MPLFGSTFSPKKTPPRKSASLSNLHNLDRSTREVELGLDYGTPTMNLAGQSLKFENGQWIAETGISGGVDRREAQRLRRRNQQLEEENNLLRLKVDILLDMLDRSTREVELGLDYGTPTMNLAGQSLKFENGQWIAGGLHFLPFCPSKMVEQPPLGDRWLCPSARDGISGGVDRREAQRLRRRNQQLEEENNLLRLKVDILLDMLSETTAESHLMEKELDELKSVSRRRK
uniref:Protein chibby homolog 1 n=1 Tax=Bos mutus grunniens TaxID=30521 RepID=A0A8B9W9F9_BOSMU